MIVNSSHVALFLLCAISFLSRGAIIPISEKTHHLGIADNPEWDIFSGKTPEGEKLELSFEARRNEREFTLFIRQDDVKQEWTVTLNGKKLGQLFLMEADLIHTLPIPPGALRDGTNELLIATKSQEDILIHRIALGDDSKEKLLTAGPVEFTVEDSSTGQPLPSRLTIVDHNGTLACIFDFAAPQLATRPGVVYTGNGRARVKLLPGKYQVFATRGPEYRLDSISDFDPQTTSSAKLTLNREADTRGWAASDTHIHTFSLSKHGDAQLRERVITLAGEAVELPISTEHNLHADYEPSAAELGLQKFFTILPGNEVTTKRGHFNIFPVDFGAKPPDAMIESWPDLLQQIRATPRVLVAILNHPTDTHSGFTPFAATNLNLVTGRNLRGDFEFTFDAMELINSGAMRSDWMEPFRAWFALLNRGYKITGIGASDSHDVSRFIVGQGRTYILMNDSDVAHLDIDQACQSLKQGHAVVSLGLFPQLTIRDGSESKAAGPGDLLPARGHELEIEVRVEAPLAGGARASLSLYANGARIPNFPETPSKVNGSHNTLLTRIPKPQQDAYYVLIATVDANPVPAWGLARPYQPATKQFRPTLIGATNPIWVDADGDGKFSSPRDYATRLVSTVSASSPDFSELAQFDHAVVTQYAELLESKIGAPQFQALFTKAPAELRKAFEEYAKARDENPSK